MRVRAVNGITDQQELYKIALTQKGEYSDAALCAIRRIQDQSLLERLAFELGGYGRQEVCKRISDESVLTRVVLEAKDFHDGEAAFDLLHSQSAFAQVALGAADEHWRRMSVTYRLTDKAALARVAREDPSGEVRRNAIQKLIELDAPELYAELELDDEGDKEWMLRMVEEKIFDAMALFVIASDTRLDEVREK